MTPPDFRGLGCLVAVLLLVGAAAPSALAQTSREAAVEQLEQMRQRAKAEEAREAKWRARHQEKLQAVEKAREYVDWAERNGGGYFSSRNPAAAEEREKAAAKLEKTEQALADFREQARRADVPPGWLRPKQ